MEKDLDNKIIRIALLAAKRNMNNDLTKSNYEVDRAFEVFDKYYDDISEAANNKIGKAIFGKEWNA